MPKEPKNSILSGQRIFGLDLMRTAAIVLVVYVHTKHLLPFQNFLSFSVYFPDGVDIFFVLSGFLVGYQMIRIYMESGQFKLTQVVYFLKRRWWRTLPNYYLFLVINIILCYFTITPGGINKQVLAFLPFLQNMFKPYDTFFWESWSLSIEEWFYLILPILVLVFSLIFKDSSERRKKIILLLSIGILLIVPLLIRFNLSTTSLDWDLYIRKMVPTRIDAIAFGLLFAYLQYFKSEFLSRSKFILLSLGILLGIGMQFIPQSPFYNRTIFFTLTSISIVLFLPAMVHFKWAKKYSFIRFTSKSSYSWYLMHIPVLYGLMFLFPGIQQSDPLVLFCFTWICSFGLSVVNFYFFERKMTALRDR